MAFLLIQGPWWSTISSTTDNRFELSIVSCNMYADRAETVVWGKAVADALEKDPKPTAVVAVSSLSRRLHTKRVADADDHVSSQMDDEWNRKLLELLADGRLEDVSQLARTFASQAHADNKLKAIWWLSAVMGAHNKYRGTVHAYGPIFGTGSAVVSLTPSDSEVGGHEFDEDDVDYFSGDREVLEVKPKTLVLEKVEEESSESSSDEVASSPTEKSGSVVNTQKAPKPVGAYPHARRVGDLLFLSGVGPRQPGTDAIPGGPIRDADKNPLDYDAAAQTRAVIENIRIILEASGSSLDRVIDVQAFLIDMDRDFKAYNKVYAEYFTKIQATRTIAIRALPTPIAVEFKVIALPSDVPKPPL